MTACSASVFKDPYNCTQYMNSELIRSQIEKHATGKKEWDLEHINTAKYRLPTPSPEIEEMCFGTGTLFYL